MYQILVAEDEPIERLVMCRKLKGIYENQIEVLQAENGRQAIELYEKHHYKIAIMDIEMPGVNGLEAAEWIRSRDSECVIIFLTAFDEFKYARRAITVKALDYLLKPCSDEELMIAVDEAMHLTDSPKPKVQEEVQTTPLVEQEQSMEIIRGNVNQRIILEYIQNHYHEEISLQDVAKALSYAEAYFCRLFRQYFKKSFTTYLSEYRVDKAKLLLTDIKINVKEIGSRVGYHDSSYFAKVFRRIVGVTPSEYRQQVLLESLGEEQRQVE